MRDFRGRWVVVFLLMLWYVGEWISGAGCGEWRLGGLWVWGRRVGCWESLTDCTDLHE